jgi:hypothetical protein
LQILVKRHKVTKIPITMANDNIVSETPSH